MAWQKILLGADREISAETDKIMAAFMKSRETVELPEDAALFSEFHPHDGSTTIWISPSASAALEEALSNYAPVTCDRPQRRNIALLVGSARSWSFVDQDL